MLKLDTGLTYLSVNLQAIISKLLYLFQEPMLIPVLFLDFRTACVLRTVVAICLKVGA